MAECTVSAPGARSLCTVQHTAAVVHGGSKRRTAHVATFRRILTARPRNVRRAADRPAGVNGHIAGHAAARAPQGRPADVPGKPLYSLS